jgi:hypothetical protein
MREVVCSCGNKVYLGDDPADEQVCSRCGERHGGAGAPAPPVTSYRPRSSVTAPIVPSRPGSSAVNPAVSAPVTRASASGYRPSADTGAVRRSGHGIEPVLTHLPGRRQASETSRYVLRSEMRRGSRLGCLVAFIAVVSGTFAADYYVNPPRQLPCGHTGRESYLFGAIPLGHSCEALEALKYANRGRVAYLALQKSGQWTPDSFADMQRETELGAPPPGTQHTFEIGRAGILVVPKLGSAGLASFLIEWDGTVRREGSGAEPTDQSESLGRFAE